MSLHGTLAGVQINGVQNGGLAIINGMKINGALANNNSSSLNNKTIYLKYKYNNVLL